MYRALGVVCLVLIIIGLSVHMDGQHWVAMAFYAGSATIVIVIIARIIRRYW